MFEKWSNGNPRVQQQMLEGLRDRFFYVALGVLHNHCDAEEAFSDAFIKVDQKVRCGDIRWQSEGQLCGLARQIVSQKALDLYRAIKKEREYELEHRCFGPADDESMGEFLNRIEDTGLMEPLEEMAFEQRQAEKSQRFQAFFNNVFSERDWRFWRAYEAKCDVPGHTFWGPHDLNRFLKDQMADLDLSDDAFNTSHTRFRQKLEPLLREWNLLS